ncbi:MAG: indolepyruvate ferredoxin oxidoreductase subunit alpha [Methanobrevibacter sp.]|jgi:indolepyruvate ferredoxin oxidoreductase alpha subunit|nr:indolepyruvate ferredoxin oxidoreductase subunit alpha [Candidatus Methanovirga procula]
MALEDILINKPKKKLFLLGNEAAVRGAIEAGISIAATYPGTPSSEIGDILHYLAKDANIYFEFSVNEKVAMEVAATAAVSGLRSFTFMKHVGLNVASDSFMTTAYNGVNGGMVILTADDPSMFSSQNEQDNRHYGRLAKIPILEPSNPQEIKDMVVYGFELSEKFKIPVIIRTTTRISHMRGIVELSEIKTSNNDNNKLKNNLKSNENVHWKKGFFKKNPNRYVPVPGNAAEMHKNLTLKFENIKKINTKLNKIYSAPKTSKNKNSKFKLGVISSGSGFNYTYDTINKYDLGIDILKLGFTHPFPEKEVLEFIKDLDGIFIVEEVDPIMEKEVLSIIGKNQLKISVFGKLNNVFPMIYEFNPDILLDSFKKFYQIAEKEKENEERNNIKDIYDEFSKEEININEYNQSTKLENTQLNKLIESLPNRHPTLCPGCPHRASYFAVKKSIEELEISEDNVIFASDIGCYTLGISPPYQTADYLLSMGSSIGDGGGLSKATNQTIMSFIGDSTFFHSGISPLINCIHNKNKFVLTILDNRTTAMTGGQSNPGLNVDGMGDPAPEISIEKIAISLGIEFVKIINPLNLKKAIETYKEAIEFDGVSVIIAKSPCALIKRLKKRKPMEIDYNKCIKCLECVKFLACPSISVKNDNIVIDPLSCKGCTTCRQMCKEKAIKIER